MRLIALAACILLLASPSGAEDLRSAFYSLPKSDRMVLQERLAEAGLYEGTIDGLWGPGTAGALGTAQQSLSWPGYSALAQESGLTPPSRALWSYVIDPDMAAGLADRR